MAAGAWAVERICLAWDFLSLIAWVLWVFEMCVMRGYRLTHLSLNVLVESEKINAANRPCRSPPFSVCYRNAGRHFFLAYLNSGSNGNRGVPDRAPCCSFYGPPQKTVVRLF